MPSYERWKYCEEPDCDEVAYSECFCNEIHRSEVEGILTFKIADHPKFVCDDHLEKYED